MSIQGELSMSTMALAEQGSARGAEAHLAAKGEKTAIGLVLIDEGLEGGVHDLDLAPHTRQATSLSDQVIAKIDHRTNYDIQIANDDIAVNDAPVHESNSEPPCGRGDEYKNPKKPGTVTVAGKASLDVPPGTLNAILKQAGLKKGRE